MFVFGESFTVCRQQFCPGHLFPISNIIISDTREGREQFYWRDRTSESLVTLSALPSSQFSTSRTKNLDTMWTLTAQYRHRGEEVLAVTGHWLLNSSNLSRISVMRTRETRQGNILDGNPTNEQLLLSCCKVSIFQPELYFIYWSQVQFSKVNGLRDSDLNTKFQILAGAELDPFSLPFLLQVILQLKVDRKRFLLILKHY